MFPKSLRIVAVCLFGASFQLMSQSLECVGALAVAAAVAADNDNQANAEVAPRAIVCAWAARHRRERSDLGRDASHVDVFSVPRSLFLAAIVWNMTALNCNRHERRVAAQWACKFIDATLGKGCQFSFTFAPIQDFCVPASPRNVPVRSDGKVEMALLHQLLAPALLGLAVVVVEMEL
jgi:hypothetical protein